MRLSVFKAKEIGKMPVSNDFKFLFENIETTIKNAYLINKDYWFLNCDYTFPDGGVKTKRNKFYLEKYLSDEFNFIILDLDKITSKIALNNIIDILKNEDLHFSLWQSSSFNGKDNFNLKGIVELKGKNNHISRLTALNYIKNLISEYCKIDQTSINTVAIQKPTHKEGFIYYHNGNNIKEFFIDENKELFSSISDSEILNLCLQVYQSKGFYVCSEKDDLISLGHPKEKTKCGYFVYKDNPQLCHHFNKEKSFSIYNDIKNTTIFKKYMHQKLENTFKDKLFLPISKKITFNNRYVSDEIIPNEIDYDEVIYVKSPMGTGKTGFIKKLSKGKKTLIITNRITLAEEYKEKFPDFKLYNQDTYFKGDSLIVQYESLHKYDLKNFDFFIIDEFMSMIEHSLSGLTDNKHFNNLKLYYILKRFHQPLLVMDAFLTGFETKFIRRKKYRYFENTYRDDNNLYIYENEDCFIDAIKKSLGDKKVTLSTTNKMFAKIVADIFKEDFKVALLTGDTNNKQIYTQHFSKNNHDEWDLLIYTPTITTGINILNDSIDHFHYSDGTGSVISSLQQIKRNRVAENIHFFLKGKKFTKIIDIDELELQINELLKKYALKDSFMVEFDEYANPKLSEMGKWNILKIYFNNLLNSNSIFSFKILLKEQFKKDLVEISDCDVDYQIKNIKENIKEREKSEFLEQVNDILNADTFDFQLMYESNFKELKEKLEKHFSDLSIDEIKKLIEINAKDKKFMKNISYITLYFKSEEAIKEMISNSIIENLNKNFIRNLELLYNFKKKKIVLKNKFTKKDLKTPGLKKFISLLGYRKKGDVYELKNTIQEFLNKIKI